MTELRQQMEWIAARGENGTHTIGALERFVIKHGYEFSGAVEIPERVMRGEMKKCFGNAAIVACMFPEEFIYTEGYALQEELPITISHGWLTDRRGNVVDPTWGNDRHVDYFGVLIKHKYVQTRMGLSLIDDYEHGWPLVRHKKPMTHIVKLEDWILPAALEAALTFKS